MELVKEDNLMQVITAADLAPVFKDCPGTVCQRLKLGLLTLLQSQAS